MRCDDDWGRADDRATHDSKRCLGNLSESHQDKLKRRAKRQGTLTVQDGVRILAPRRPKHPADAISAYLAQTQLRAQLADSKPAKKERKIHIWAAKPTIPTVLALPPEGTPQPEIDDPDPIERDSCQIQMAQASDGTTVSRPKRSGDP